jgi:hypothetical protein
MKTSKFLCGTLVVALFMVVPAIAGVPGSFTGNVEADFDPGLYEVLVITDPSLLGANEITVVYPPLPDPNATVYTSGWNIKDLRLAYDPGSDILYVGVNSYGIVGDVDGNGDPNTSFDPDQWNDYPDLSNGESVAVYFDLDMLPATFSNNQSWDVIAGVRADLECSGFSVATMNLTGGFNPGSNFGTPLPYHYDPTPPHCPSATWPDYEFTILHFSELVATLGLTDPNGLGEFRVGVYAGSQNDGNVGEDFIYYHQRPSTMVTIASSALQPGDPPTVDLTVTEENDSPSAFLGQQTGPSNPVGLPFHGVEVYVAKNGSPLATLTSPPDDGDTGSDGIMGIGEIWTWDSRTSALNDVEVPVITHFEAFGSGVDPAGFIHDFLEDAQEANSVDVMLPPAIDVTKTVDCEETLPGYPVYYEICIKNTGPVPVIPTLVYDDKLGDLTADFVGVCPILYPPPDPCECCLTFGPFTQDALVDPNINTVTFDANDLSGNAAPTATDTATVNLVDPNFTVEKICLTDPVEGDTATFRIIITNTGDVDLSVTTNEPNLPGQLPLPAGGPPIDVNIYVPVPVDVTEVCNSIIVEATIDEPNNICIDGVLLPPKDANDCCEIPGGGEGCTPGFWKNNADKWNASAWCDLFSPSMKISDVFELDEPLTIFIGGNPNKSSSYITDPTLLQALGANGGGVNAMIRHGVAAMLNACSDCVNYPNNDPFEIVLMIEDTLNGVPGAYSVDELHYMFAGWNEYGCPVNQKGECVGVDEVDGIVIAE